MKLIADSGSTKTDWRIIDEEGQIQQAVTAGINPYYQTKDEITYVIDKELKAEQEPAEIYFYGAGCSTEGNKNKVEQTLRKKFRGARILVEDDMLAAARSLSGREKGIICIIGTGSNACLYDGEFIKDSIPSLGYVMGDEASGNWLGKQLISDYFGKQLSEENRRKFEAFGVSNVQEILDQVYKQPKPSAFLANYSQLIQENIGDPYFYNLVYDAFKHFINTNVKFFEGYDQLPVHFTGSIAFIYGNILRKAAADENIFVDKVIQSPIAGLTLFHQTS